MNWFMKLTGNTNDLGLVATSGTAGPPTPVVPFQPPPGLEPVRVWSPPPPYSEMAALRALLAEQAKEIGQLQDQLRVIYLRCVFCGDEVDKADQAEGLACTPCTAAVAYTRKKMFEEAREVFMEISREIAES